MYHGRFKGTHYDIGFKWGTLLYEHGKHLLEGVPFPLTKEREDFAMACMSSYEIYFPEILEEIRGIAQGQKIPDRQLFTLLLSMYCIMPENKCSCFAFKNKDHMILARNSDFLTEIEKLYMNCIYKFTNTSYSFNGNTTAFVEMEDGVNEHGLAIGLTSVYPKTLGHGLNAGLLLRYGLEKCRTVTEFIDALKWLPIASSQTFTAADETGKFALIECNCEQVAVYAPEGEHDYVSAVNAFNLDEMQGFRMDGIDDWHATKRYETIQNAFGATTDRDIDFAANVLAGKYGFMCQYDRSTGKDTVWSVIYDIKQRKLLRCEGNPSRRKFKEDSRFLWNTLSV